MLAGGVLLGSMGVFLHESGAHAVLAVWARCLTGALALLAGLALFGRLSMLRVPRAQWTVVAAISVLMLCNWGLFFWALRWLPIGLATVVFHVQPFMLMALGGLLLREPVRTAQVTAAALALLGLALASGLGNWGSRPHLALGLVLCLCAASCYALIGVLARWRPVNPWALSFWQCAIGAVLLLPWPLTQPVPTQVAAWLWLSALGVLHTALAYVLLYQGMARLQPAQVALWQFVYPGAALLFDALVYGQVLTPLQSLGVALMGFALWWARPAATLKKAASNPTAPTAPSHDR